jgi:hypothetical protein
MLPRLYPDHAEDAALSWGDPWSTLDELITGLPGQVVARRRRGLTWRNVAGGLGVPIRVALAWYLEAHIRGAVALARHTELVLSAWMLTLLGLLDRSGHPSHDPTWWWAWLSTTLRPWYRGCQPMAPWSRQARDTAFTRPIPAPARPEVPLDQVHAELIEARMVLRRSWTYNGTAQTWWMPGDHPAQLAHDELRDELESRATWMLRRGLPLREQVALLVTLDLARRPVGTPVCEG